ncbi:MAG: DUF2318 domain-containing protein [Erysipelotrichaceae bacterium]|nr:DUF2318 domain-containing protein [Erysipelotrichaceae bacterium]
MKIDVKSMILPIIAIVVVIAAILTIIVPKINSHSETDNLVDTATSDLDIAVFSSDVQIVESDISEIATYYDYDSNNTIVELFAVKASDGTIRLALNTCQVCMGSPYAYFVQNGDDFICQNCKNHFDIDNIGIEQGGCNPVPITDDNYSSENGVITVSSDFLAKYEEQFSNWKSF